MVAGGDEHAGFALVKRLAQRVKALPVDLGPVKQVARKQHKLAAQALDLLAQAQNGLSLTGPAQGGLGGGVPGKGAVKVEISGVDQTEHSQTPFLCGCKDGFAHRW